MAGGPELMPFSKDQTSEMGVWRGVGGREGPTPPHQQSLGRMERQEKQGLWPGSWGGDSPAGLGCLASVPGSLEGLPLLPKLFHRAWGWGRGRAHVLLGFPQQILKGVSGLLSSRGLQCWLQALGGSWRNEWGVSRPKGQPLLGLSSPGT